VNIMIISRQISWS